MFVNHFSAQILTFPQYHKLFCFLFVEATYWSPLPISPLMNKLDFSQLTSLMLSSNFMFAVFVCDYKTQFIHTEWALTVEIAYCLNSIYLLKLSPFWNRNERQRTSLPTQFFFPNKKLIYFMLVWLTKQQQNGVQWQDPLRCQFRIPLSSWFHCIIVYGNCFTPTLFCLHLLSDMLVWF